jgi:phosphate transport system substrate-binding protein
MVNFKNIVVIFSISLLFVACKTKSNDKFTDTLTSGVIPITVDENFKPIIQEEIAVFENLYKGTGIVPLYTNEVEAINLLLKDSVRLAITSRPLYEKEINFLKNKKFAPRSYKLATDAIALIVNRQNPDTLITVDQLRKILVGEKLEWNQLHSTSKLGKIILVFDNANSSTVRYAIDSLCHGRPLSKELCAQTNNLEVIKYVANTPGSIGLIGVNWIGEQSDTTNLSFNKSVRVMSVSNEKDAIPENSYKPFQYYILYGYYPLTRNVYVILNDPRSTLPSGFTNFLTTDRGQRIILKSGLVPATQPIRIVNVNNE